MGFFDKITHTINLTPNTTKEQVEEYLSKCLWPRPNDDIEFIVPQFNAKKHYQYLKKMIWKHYRR